MRYESIYTLLLDTEPTFLAVLNSDDLGLVQSMDDYESFTYEYNSDEDTVLVTDGISGDIVEHTSMDTLLSDLIYWLQYQQA